MPKVAHVTAAYHHERAAKSHRAAAQQSNVGAHAASELISVEACEHSAKADEASKLAHEMSVQRTKAVPLATK